MSLPSSNQITLLQDQCTEGWHNTDISITESHFLALVQENHSRNFQLWHEEDEARREDIGHAGVYRAKRAIDAFNQQRNDFIEKMDIYLFKELSPAEDVPKNSETLGSMIDRLSILSLKKYHMAEEVSRKDADVEHREKCQNKVETILLQIKNLGDAYDQLIDEVVNKTRSFSVYFQFKMYNDPNLNPKLYNPT